MTLVDLAKTAVESYVNRGEIISPPSELPEEFLMKRSGTFVTIEKNGRLRGCIGTYLPVQENIAREVINNAAASAAEDYRFGPVRKEELPHLSYTVYILNKPELVYPIKSREAGAAKPQFNWVNPVKSAKGGAKQFNWVKDTKELDPKKYGIIVKTVPISLADDTDGSTSSPQDVVFNGHLPFKSGLLLPDLEGVDSVEQQIFIACQKGGIKPDKEKVFIYRFTVKKYQ